MNRHDDEQRKQRRVLRERIVEDMQSLGVDTLTTQWLRMMSTMEGNEQAWMSAWRRVEHRKA